MLGLTFLTKRVDVEVTPTVRYWGQLILGLVLIARLARVDVGRTATTRVGVERRAPQSVAVRHRRVGRRAGAGGHVGALPDRAGDDLRAQSVADGVARDRDRILRNAHWRRRCWCSALSVRKTMRARRMQRRVVRVMTRFGPLVVRTLFLAIGLVLVADALWHYAELW